MSARHIIESRGLRHHGAAPEKAGIFVLALHGRGATAEGILPLADALGALDFCWIAPQSPGDAWFPNRFIAPVETNEPDYGQALRLIDHIVRDLVEAGVAQSHIVLTGFSQGASLSLDYAARRGGRFGAVLGFSGGLMGATLSGQHYRALDATPVLIGASEDDALAPRARLRESAEILRGLGADVHEVAVPGSRHEISAQELEAARALIALLRGE